jgi:hypothetical protein
MTILSDGIVWPQTAFTPSWFAYNTIDYVGLTLAKLVPLPRQLRPSLVRDWLRGAGIDPDRNSARENFPARALIESENLTRIYGAAWQEIPQVFALVGGFAILIALVNVLTFFTVNIPRMRTDC